MPLRGSAFGVLDTWRNVTGGVLTGSAQVSALELRLEADGAALGWPGLSGSISALGTASHGPTARLTGDLQTADNKDATTGVRLYEAWVRQSFRAASVKAGVFDLNSEFNVSESGGLFVNGAQGMGLDLGQVGSSGPSVYPAPHLGVMGALGRDTTLKAAIFDGLSQPAGPHHSDTAAREHGALAIMEVSRGAAASGRIALGVWRDSGGYGSTLQALQQHAASGGYLLAERTLWTSGHRWLTGMIRLGTADPKILEVGRHLTADLVLNRPFLDREGEALGLGVVRAETGEHARSMRLARGDAPAAAETAIEATYRLPLGHGFGLQPDVQYLVHPGAVRARSAALLVGIRLTFAGTLTP